MKVFFFLKVFFFYVFFCFFFLCFFLFFLVFFFYVFFFFFHVFFSIFFFFPVLFFSPYLFVVFVFFSFFFLIPFPVNIGRQLPWLRFLFSLPFFFFFFLVVFPGNVADVTSFVNQQISRRWESGIILIFFGIIFPTVDSFCHFPTYLALSYTNTFLSSIITLIFRVALHS